MLELWDLYNKNQEKTGLTLERGKSIPKELYHLVVSAWIVNNRGEYLISQRHPNKSYPLYWECTGGSVLAGESSLEGAIREVREELGIILKDQKAQLIYQTRRERTQDFYDVWVFYVDAPITSLSLQATEVINAKWVDKEKLYDMFYKQELHPLIDYIDRVIK